MSSGSSSAHDVSQRTPIAACVAAIFALSAPAAFASVGPTTRFVTNCTDADPGSLRATVATANEGDTISMVELPTTYACSTISLTTGAISVARNNLTLRGPSTGVTINHQANTEQDRVITHTGTGTLSLDYLTISGGYEYSSYSDVKGGCINSAGSVYLGHTKVTSCKTGVGPGYFRVFGGGIFTANNLTMTSSTISDNVAGTTYYGLGFGGGAYVGGNFNASYSTISGNAVGTFSSGRDGAVSASKGVTINSSTISGNSASSGTGAFGMYGSPAIISNSTISGNTSNATVGGIYTNTSITVQNSTIAFNTAAMGKNNSQYAAPGLALSTNSGKSITLNLQSTLITGNTYAGTENDLSVNNFNSNTVSISGTGNLVRVTKNAGLPSGTLQSCPFLGPLRNNGGPTQTHALSSHSPGIDQGNNLAALSFDQRGSTFSRVYNVADIGAYEVQAETVFNSSFDGCL